MPQTPVIEAWLAVMEDVRAVGKGSFNEQQRFKFRGIDAVLNAVGPALRKHGVVVTPQLIEQQYEQVTVGSKATLMGHARVIVRYTAHCDGDSLVIAEVPGEAMDVGDKGLSKAMSVAYRTALIQSLTLPTDEPDPDSETYERAQQPATPQQIAELNRLLNEAGDLATLREAGLAVAKSSATPEQRTLLRDLYEKREAILREQDAIYPEPG